MTTPAIDLTPAHLTRDEAVALAHQWDRLARYFANRAFRRTGRRGDPADYLAAARLGLWEAALRFDPTRGLQFGTYGGWWARRRTNEVARQEAAGGTRARAGAFVAVRVVSLDALGDSDGGPFPLAAPDAPDAPGGDPAVWREADRLLPCRRQRLVVWLYYRCGWSDADIARSIGVSRGRPQQIRAAALARLRRHAARFAAAAAD